MTESPIITLPENPELRRRLVLKLKEYEGRMSPYGAPEQQMDSICKIAVLSNLIKDGKLVCWELGGELSEKYGTAFAPSSFRKACAVIADYTLTGGRMNHGGTGLPA